MNENTNVIDETVDTTATTVDTKEIITNIIETVGDNFDSIEKLESIIEALKEVKKAKKEEYAEALKEAKKAEKEAKIAEAKEKFKDIKEGDIITFTMSGKEWTLPVTKKNPSTFTVEGDFGTKTNKRYIKFENILSVETDAVSLDDDNSEKVEKLA